MSHLIKCSLTIILLILTIVLVVKHSESENYDNTTPQQAREYICRKQCDYIAQGPDFLGGKARYGECMTHCANEWADPATVLPSSWI
jgi:hypothetical protein